MASPRREQFRRIYKLVEDLGISLSELGLRFVLSNQDVSTILTGVKSLEELEHNIKAIEAGPLPQSTLERIQSIAAMVPFRPYEEPYKLPFNSVYKGPGPIGHF